MKAEHTCHGLSSQENSRGFLILSPLAPIGPSIYAPRVIPAACVRETYGNCPGQRVCRFVPLQNAGVPIEPPVQTKLVDATSALPGVLCAGVPGAGGVDAVFAIVVHPHSEKGVRDLWASWRVGEEPAEGLDGGEDPSAVEGFVCPLLLTAAEGGLQSGMLCTRQLSWQ